MSMLGEVLRGGVARALGALGAAEFAGKIGRIAIVPIGPIGLPILGAGVNADVSLYLPTTKSKVHRMPMLQVVAFLSERTSDHRKHDWAPAQTDMYVYLPLNKLDGDFLLTSKQYRIRQRSHWKWRFVDVPALMVKVDEALQKFEGKDIVSTRWMQERR